MFISEDIHRKVTERYDKCPYCQEVHIIKYGKFHGKQRFQCKDCKRTFSIRTNTPWYYSKKSNETWKEFCNFMINKATLKECATKLKMNIATAFYWRHKILNALNTKEDEEKILSNYVYITKDLIPENFKGISYASNKPKKKIWVIMCGDSNDNVILKPLTIGPWNRNRFEEVIHSRMASSCLVDVKNVGYLQSLTRYGEDGEECWRFYPEHKEGHRKSEDLAMRTFFTFEDIKRKACGIGTKYLKHYLELTKLLVVDEKITISNILYTLYDRSAYVRSKDIKLATVL